MQFSTAQTKRDIQRSKLELKGALNKQYELILIKGENYQTDSISFKVIKNRYLQAFKEHLNDSLLMYKSDFNDLEVNYDKLITQNDLTIKINEAFKEENQKLTKAHENILFLNAEISQSDSLWKFWLLPIILFFVIVFLGRKYFLFSIVQKESLLEKNSAIEQLDDFRKKALVREQKLNRKILDLEKMVPSKNITN